MQDLLIISKSLCSIIDFSITMEICVSKGIFFNHCSVQTLLQFVKVLMIHVFSYFAFLLLYLQVLCQFSETSELLFIYFTYTS